MKKVSLFFVSSLLALTAMGQKNLVDAVSKDISGFTPDFKAAREKLKPAFTNPESEKDARTYFVAGKLEFGLYDNLLGKKQIKQEVNDQEMANALLNGYNFMMKALPLDSIVDMDKNGQPKLDKNGKTKVKTKFSKDIAGAISGHHNDFNIAGGLFYDGKDYGKAYEAWKIFSELPKAEYLGKLAPQIADTIIGQTQFYEGISAWQNKEEKKAVEAFAKARKNGYQKKEAFDYAMACYSALKDNDGIIALAKEAFPIYGNVDTQYISILINDYINKSQYKEANDLLDKAIKDNPKNAEFYNVKGSLYENQKDSETAFTYYQKAIEINPDYAKGQFDVGRYYFNKAVKMRDEINKLKGAAYQKAITEQLNPLYKQALPYLEKAYKLDSENLDAKNALKNIYYFLGDETKLNALDKQ